jgi:LPXTG-motif cell wall-anchored protein
MYETTDYSSYTSTVPGLSGTTYSGDADPDESGTSWLDILNNAINSIVVTGGQLLGNDPVTGTAGDTTIINSPATPTTGPSSTTVTTIIAIVLGALVVGGLIFLAIRKSRKNKKA